jgi:hypothetical protein
MRKAPIFLALLLFPTLAFADPSYSVKIDAAPTKKAQPGTVKIHIAPGTGYHVNKDYPTKLTVTPPAGATVAAPKQTIAEAGADFELTYTCTEVGQKTFTGELKFAVCTATTCDPKKEKVTFTVDVK